MNRSLALVAAVAVLGAALATDADARRLGGGRSSGMQRQSVTAPATPPAAARQPQAAPAQAAPATAAAAPGAAAAAAPKRSWLGPVAGLAAGLGLAALASHFGFGEALANVMTIALLAMAVLLVVGFVLRKRAAAQGPQLAGAGAPYAQRSQASDGSSLIGSRIGAGMGGVPVAGAQAGRIPAGFDTAAFERNAIAQFMGLQAANDAADLGRLREYLSPEMLELVGADLAERGSAAQRTEVFGLRAQVLDVAEEADRYVVSVHFTGSVREQQGAAPQDLDEIWHLAKPRTGADGWLVAGIQQRA